MTSSIGSHDPQPQDPQEVIRELAAVTPAALADEIRAATADVYARAQAWRRSPKYRGGDKLHRKAYEVIAVAVAELDGLPEPRTHREVGHLVDAIAPILSAWWADDPGPQKDLSDAVERLRHVAMHRTAWVRQARSLLGQDR
jgi:hypothetical protein